ncbi:MAG: hypothetical protein N0C84_00495 [Candidatus Thiodiazotropha taylori]|uniref:Uncharacterized protein n=1 Tax=Candidatus Thiodiazotropha taylori TaxID=2792791 RepID=A0A9E4K994_9GAMM|nr:hypothetical protein [Candidatus Thiodiazotropha taylori]MCW4254923.1 hypothetical protein [Candidatus Thiodiazotropha taylori]
MKKLALIALLFSSTQASALSFGVDYNVNANHGIQKLDVVVSHDESTFITLTIRDQGPLPENLFKTPLKYELNNIPVYENDPVELPIYFKVPKKGYFKYEICASTSPVPVSDDSADTVRIRVCNEIRVRN